MKVKKLALACHFVEYAVNRCFADRWVFAVYILKNLVRRRVVKRKQGFCYRFFLYSIFNEITS